MTITKRRESLRAENLRLRREVEDLRSSMGRQETLLKEARHRMKNNLSTILGLLRLQSRYARDDGSKAFLRDCRNRVAAMSLVHEGLSRGGPGFIINAGEYFRTLAARTFKSFGADPGRVRLKVVAPDMEVDSCMVIPCGLIVNELLSNALKHAFPGSTGGTVLVEFSADMEKGSCTLRVSDDGSGLPEGVDISNPSTMGLTLVSALSKQIGADMEVDRSKGTDFRISFGPRGRSGPAF